MRLKLGQMRLNQRVTPASIDLVKRFEGYRPNAARLPDGRWTVGYAHVRFARQGLQVTREEAQSLLYLDLSDVADQIDRRICAPLNDNQFSALTAFAFNIGLDSFASSRVLQLVNEGEYNLAAGAMEMWRRVELGGQRQVVDALVRRRAAEKALFLAPLDYFPVVSSRIVQPLSDLMFTSPSSLQGVRPAIVSTPLTGEVTRMEIVQQTNLFPPTEPAEPVATPALAASPSQAHEQAPNDSTVVADIAPLEPVAALPDVRRDEIHRRSVAKRRIVSPSLPFYLAAVVGIALFAHSVTLLLREASLGNLLLGVLGVVLLAPGLGRLIVALILMTHHVRSAQRRSGRQSA